MRWRGGRCDRCHYQQVHWRWHGERLCDDCLQDARLLNRALPDVTSVPGLPPRDRQGRFRARPRPDQKPPHGR